MDNDKYKFDHSQEECYAALDKAEKNGTPLLADELLYLGVALLNGEYGLKTDTDRGHDLVRRAADASHPLACLQIARSGLGEKELPGDTKKYLLTGAAAGEVECMTFLAMLKNVGLIDDPAEVSYIESKLNEAAWRLYPEALALRALEIAHLDSRTPEQVMDMRLYAALALINGGSEMLDENLELFFNQSDCKADGTIRLDKVVKESSDSGNPLAQWDRFLHLVTNQDGTIRATLTEGQRKLLKAAVAGHVPDAMEHVALEAVSEKRFSDAIELLRQPVEMKMPEPMLSQGMLMIMGDGTEKNVPEGLTYVEKSLEFGLPLSCMTFADLVDDGVVDDPYGCRADFYRYNALNE